MSEDRLGIVQPHYLACSFFLFLAYDIEQKLSRKFCQPMLVAPTVRYCSDLDLLFIESYSHWVHCISMILRVTIARYYKVGLVIWCSELAHLSFYFVIDYIFWDI